MKMPDEITNYDEVSDALDIACKIEFNDSCPLDDLEVEPWEDGCDEVCSCSKRKEEWKCWRQFFINQVSS